MVGSSRADELVVELRKMLESARGTGNLGPLVGELLDSQLSRLEAFEAELLQLQGYVVLNGDTDAGEEMARALALWESFNAGTRTSDVASLVDSSPTLSALYRGAVSFDGVYRYSKKQIDIATHIGNRLAAYPQYMTQFVRRARDDAFAIKTAAVSNVRSVINDLTRLDVFDDFKLQGAVSDGEGREYWRDEDRLEGRRANKWRVKVGSIDDGFRDLLGGHWLSAYAYSIAYDQFSRAGAPFEIYSRVEYRLPDDRGGGRSDIDVLVRTSDVLLCIECKSGSVLDVRQRVTPAAKFVRDSARLDALLDSMQVGLDRHYQLVYQETEKEPLSDVEDAVAADRRTHVATPAQLRAIVQKIALGQEIGGAERRVTGGPRCDELCGSWLKIVSSGYAFAVDLAADGSAQERDYFDDELPYIGAWSRTVDGLQLVIDDWTAVLTGETGQLFTGLESHPDGSSNRVLLVRVPSLR